MKEEIKETTYTTKMQEAFYVEELEDRFEMAPIGEPVPNLACWEINF